MDDNELKLQIAGILSVYGKDEAKLVPILLAVQSRIGFLPQEAVQQVGEYLGITPGQIYSVASFYTYFKLKPVGNRRITVCRGTACHIRGAPQVLDEISKVIGVNEGETSPDLEYTLETVACIGCCALAPAIKINEEVHGSITPREAKTFFTRIKREEKNAH